MIPQNQINKTGCLQACIASLLELPISLVPNFMEEVGVNGDYPAYYESLQRFLSMRGFAFYEAQLHKVTWMPLVFPVMAIFVGEIEVDVLAKPVKDGQQRTRKARCRHMVIGHCVDGKFHLDHDPLPGERKFVSGIQAVCFLIPNDPARMKLEPKNIIAIPT